ncbi:MAG: TAT-variant-translocated molybdopterin oxidoreductase [Oligoflexia bacterium]|nr:TAT-variant-translocated molybdopterin oxidoreductase [Oligoflexia bacterium]
MEQHTERKYWGSLEEYHNEPGFIEKANQEFTSSPIRDGVTEETDGTSRRDFMKLMAASTALASTACYQKPMHKILPYVNQPEEVTFGVANYYASTCGECSTGCGTLVKTREGRPIKIEGNPDHPINKGGLCARGQASILNLYDPDRLRSPSELQRGSLATSAGQWDAIDRKISDKLKAIKNGSGRVRILSSTINSPSTNKLIEEFLSGFKNGELVSYDPINLDNVIASQELSYGTKILPRYRFDEASVIVSIDGDFLGTLISPVEFTKQFSKNRKVDANHKKMAKLIVFESTMSLTGTNSDERTPIRPTDGAHVALALAYELIINLKAASADASVVEALKNYSPESVAMACGFNVSSIKKAALALSKAKGKSLVISGSPQSQTENALSLQVAVDLLNSILQNDGVTVDYNISPSLQAKGSFSEVKKLVKEMNAGSVDALFIYNSNPAYNLPQELGFLAAAKKVGLVVSFSSHIDESAVLADFICPDNHKLESWGDAQAQKGVYSLTQPTIRPIYNTRSFEDSLLAFNKMGALGIGKLVSYQDFHAYVQTNWRETVFKEVGTSVGFEIFWESALRDGVVDMVAKNSNRSKNSSARSFKSSALTSNLPKAISANGFEIALYSKVSMYDGATSNNPWLQEMPDPVSRITWDNYASVSPQAAEEMHLVLGDIVKLTIGDKTIELPAHVQPGLHNKVIAVALGYGRENAGLVGSKIGKNMFALTMSKDLPVLSGHKVALKKTGAKHLIAIVQEQSSLQGRPHVKEATLKKYQEKSNAGNEHHEKLTTVWSGHEYKGYRWAMAIDLNSCTGCGACVIGCQSENNVPVVGKENVSRGRIMHWIRVDRYYTGTPDNPQTVHQLMLCQHCENAPCETVCPVIATAHSDEGLNQQIYNRCVGTRYCANNCPYKVRRFNWFDYNYSGQTRYPMTLAQNPEVTIRSRGVMEKCTFCIQRITEVKNTAKDMSRSVKDGELKTACQQSCPADAIVFGNINDSTSLVTLAAKDPRGYHVLEELNTRPSVTYMTKIRNVEQL